MEELLRTLIMNENKKQPYTDERLAQKLGINREEVTNLRKKLNIPDSRNRRKPVILADIENIFKENPDISNRALAKCLNDKGYNIAKYAVAKLREEVEQYFIEENISEKTIINEEESTNIFKEFIGSDGSLKTQIKIAQAAIQYPPKGLHCLIYGPSGVGKSYLAELMHKYACTIDIFGENTPYFEFNCADYADNPQLLLAQLFGYNKGAFTGATDSKKGVVEMCDGGILFLDEVHRLPPEGQEILFYLMDKGKFRRLGEVDTERKSHLMVIAATTEDPQNSLLLTFRRRIPMTIEIPALKDRTISEKLQLISMFFNWESIRLKKKICIREDVLKKLLIEEWIGNVGQLKSYIQVCCAKAFLENRLLGKDDIIVTLNSLTELPNNINKNKKQIEEIDKIISGDLYVFPDKNSYYKKKVFQDWDIYDKIEKKYIEMKEEGLSQEKIVYDLSQEIETSFKKNLKEAAAKFVSMSEVIKIVGEEAFNITKEIYEYCKSKLPDLEEGILFPLSIHIKTALERIRNHKSILSTDLVIAKQINTIEYNIAQEAVKNIEKYHYTLLPEEEIGFIAMYLKYFQKQKKETKIGVLVISHGQVAEGMANVANTIMGVDHAVGLNLNLWETPEQMKKRVIEKAVEINEGKGILLMADMGSLLQIGEEVEKAINAPCKTVSRTDTMMVIEAVRKTMWTEESLDEIVYSIMEETGKNIFSSDKNIKRKKAILCLCVTGEGAAKILSQYISKHISSSINGISILEHGYIENSDISKIFKTVEEKYEILAVVGTINPEYEKYPFISSEEIYKSYGLKKLRQILKKNELKENNILSDVINIDTIFITKNNIFKDEVIDNSVQLMIDKGYVKEEFLLSVYKREGMMTTALNNGIAIPHGGTELVTKPVICVTKLDKPISWDGITMVDIIFTLGLTENSKKYFEQLYQIISDDSLVNQIRKAKTKEEILSILT